MKKLIALMLAAAAAASPVLAGGTAHWTHSTEADFKKGKLHNVVATNLGDVKLSRAVKTLLEQDAKVTSVYCMIEGPDGTIYAGTGPQGVILQVKGDKVSTLATLADDENVYALAIDAQGRLLAGTGGEKGRVLRFDKPGADAVEVFTEKDVQYVWQLCQTPDGNLYAATGPNGQLFEIKPDGSHSVLFDCDENNILSLVSNGKDILYAGTDPNGLVYRINRKTKDAYVLYDAAETEISALALDAKGNLYAGTAQAGDTDEAGAGDTPTSEKAGRPDAGDTANPIPLPAPAEPKPPTPDPNPNEPDRIPKTPGAMLRRRGEILANSGPRPLWLMMAGAPSTTPATRPHAHTPKPSPEDENPPTDATLRALKAAIKGQTPNPGHSPATPAATEGNAIYKIDPEGFVTEIFRQPAMVLSIIERNGDLIVGTGSEGLVYQVNPTQEETSVLAKVDPKQVMSLLAAKDGRILLGLANVGGLAAMSSGFALDGTYTSPVLDATQTSRFGKLHVTGSLPPGAALTISTRSGNVGETSEKGWAKWSDEAPAQEFLPVTAPTARYLQYRLTLKSTDGKATPVVDAVDVAHQVPNLAPQIKGIKIVSAGEEGGPTPGPRPGGHAAAANPGGAAEGDAKEKSTGRLRTITWEAADPNSDTLEYTLYFRSGVKGPWILLQDKLKEPTHNWDTRGVPDGRYQIKVVASDAKANPRGEGKESVRISDPVVIDNTPPVIGDLKAAKLPKGVRIEARIVDRTSTVAAVDYAVDSKEDWQAVPASDNIFDSPEEGVSFSIEDLSAGAHQIMVRATDDHGNQAYETVQVTVEK